MSEANPAALASMVVWGAFALAFVFGAVANRTNFCTLVGVGMTLGSGCGSKTLVRIGGGNLKSVVVFIMLAVSAYMTLKGLFGVFRVAAIDPVAVALPAAQDLPSLLAKGLGGGRNTMLAVVAGVLGAGL